MNRRWTCPNTCGQPARLAPERARGDDTRTYCLPCSERTGRLVRRVCEAAEKKRAVKAQTKAERAKTERAEAAEKEERERIDNAGAIATGQQIRTGYYYEHKTTGQTLQDGPPQWRPFDWDRKKHAPAFAQISQTLYVAAAAYHYATDIAREASMRGLERVDATAPGLFPSGARQYIAALPRAPADQHSGVLFNWTVICEALAADARRMNRATLVIDPGTPHTTAHGPVEHDLATRAAAAIERDRPHIHATVTHEPPLAQLVRENLLKRLRKGHPIIHPIADEIECAPAAFRGH